MPTIVVIVFVVVVLLSVTKLRQ